MNKPLDYKPTEGEQATVSLDQLQYILNYFIPNGFDYVSQVICFGRYVVLIPKKLGRLPLSMVVQAHGMFYEITQDEYFGLKLGAESGLSRFQLMINLFQGIDRKAPAIGAEELSLFSDAFDIGVQFKDDCLELHILTDPRNTVSRFQYDSVMTNLRKAFAFFSPSIEPEWYLPRELSESEIAVYKKYLGPNLHTESDAYKVVLPAKFLQSSDRIAPELLEQTKLTMQRGLKAQQEQQRLFDLLWRAIEANFSDGLPKLGRVAEYCGLTTRQVQYQLSGYGIQYQQLLDGFLMERLVQSLQAQPEATPQELAEQLQFSEVRSFKRSVKRWFDKPYSEVTAIILRTK